MNDLNKISVFPACNNPHPFNEISVRDFCKNVISGFYKNEVERVRNETDEIRRKDIKPLTPCVIISGTFNYRSNEKLITHSGFICLDIDNKHNPEIDDWPAFRNSIMNIQNVYFAALSISGQGVFVIMPIANETRHSDHYRMLEEDFKDLGIVLDPACKDVSHLRIVSYDPDAIINPNAITYQRVYNPPPPKPFKHKTEGAPLDRLIAWSGPFTNGYRHNSMRRFVGACHRIGIPIDECRAKSMEFIQDDFTVKEIEDIFKYIYK